MREVSRLCRDKGIKIIITDLDTILKGLNEENLDDTLTTSIENN